MSDRELLEAAAKAAGIVLADYGGGKLFQYWIGESGTYQEIHWNPLTDDGDALRLAVKLGLLGSTDIQFGDKYCVVHYVLGDEYKQSSEMHDADPYAATRRAIVRAAAEIGREKP